MGVGLGGIGVGVELAGIGVAVGLGVGVRVGPGVWSTQRAPSSHVALKTTAQSPHEPSTGAAQLVGH